MEPPPGTLCAIARYTEDRATPNSARSAPVWVPPGLVSGLEPPFETKDLATGMAAVSMVYAGTGSVGDILAGVRAFRVRFSSTRVEGLPDELHPRLTQRLSDVDKLLADGVIKPEEHSAQRARILGEL